MVEQVNDSKNKSWGEKKKVLAIVATTGKQALKVGYYFSIVMAKALNGQAANWEQIKQDADIQLEIAKNHVEYTGMMAKLEAQAHSKDVKKREQAEKLLAHAKVINILANMGLEMLGVSASRMMIYKRDALVKKKLDAIKKPEQKLTRMQQMNSYYNETLSDEEILKESLINAITSRIGLEGVDIAEVIDSVLRTKVTDITKTVSEKVGIAVVGDMVSDSLFGKRDYEQAMDNLKKSENYANNIIDLVADVEASQDMVRTYDNQVSLSDLYVDCKKNKNMDPFYAKIESLYTEAFALYELEVNPHYKTKVGQKGKKLGDNLTFLKENMLKNMGRGRVKGTPQKA